MSFDPDVFLNTEVTDAFETKYTPVPKGEYSAFIDDIQMRTINESPVLRLIWAIPDEKLAETLGVEKAVVFDDLFLDVEEDGRLQFGPNKNVRLGRVREALRQNVPGTPWNFNMLRGAGPAVIVVGERFDKKTGEGPFASVDKVKAA